MSDTPTPTCPRGPLCAAATPVYLPDGTRGTRTPVDLDHGHTLCRADTAATARALSELPALVARVDLEHLPALAIRYDPDPVSTGEPVGAPIPLNAVADAITRLIDCEVWHWAHIVATAAGLRAAGEWSGLWSAMSRPGARIQAGATLLAYRLDQWLTLPPMRYVARSMTCDPADAPMPGHLVWDDGWWIERTGAEAACVLLELVRHAHRIVETVRPLWTPGTCTYHACGKAGQLYRHPQLATVVCRACGNSTLRDDYLALQDAARAAAAAQERVAS